MKAKEVMKVLNITRPTLSKYVSTGLIKSFLHPETKRHNYDADSVYALLELKNKKVKLELELKNIKKSLRNFNISE